jgi:hypothetical protein
MAATARALEARFPAPYLAAMALDRGDLGVSALGQLWQGSGLERQREVLVARRGGRAVAAAILDLASPGLHVYGLLDKIRLVALANAGEDEFERLLGAAHGRYAATGHSSCVYFRDLGAPALPSRIAHSSMGVANISVLARSAAASFLEHVFLPRVAAPAAATRRTFVPPAREPPLTEGKSK